MDFHPNIPLKNYTTMGLGGPALFMAEAHTAEDVAVIYRHAKAHSLPIFVLGGGSNVIASDEGYKGIILRMRIAGFEIISDDLNSTVIRVGAGELWDNTVKRVIDMNLNGMAALSAIPGTTGAGPVQNIGAYGQEIADTLQSIEAYDSQNDTMVTLQNADCEFSYRESIFRGREKGRYVITAVTFKLSKNSPQPPFYDAVQKYFDEHNIQTYTQQNIRDAVTDIRTNKLPDPKLLPNAGSFFKNAIVEQWKLNELRTAYPDMPAYDMGEGKFKLSTGWLIEKTGLKGSVIHGIRIHDKNCLVLINQSATSYNDLALAREQIIGTIRDTFGVQIIQEPLEI